MTEGKRGPQPGEGGAPKITIETDPDRHAISVALAFECAGLPQLRACREAVALCYAREIEPGQKQLARDERKGLATRSYELLSRPGAPATMDGKAATLRRKLAQDRTPQEALWLKSMAMAFMVAVKGTHCDLNKQQVRGWCSSVGESEWAEKVLIPMIDARQSNI